MKNNVTALKGLKNVYITACESESEAYSLLRQINYLWKEYM